LGLFSNTRINALSPLDVWFTIHRTSVVNGRSQPSLAFAFLFIIIVLHFSSAKEDVLVLAALNDLLAAAVDDAQIEVSVHDDMHAKGAK
jgi:hypothetical protein